MAIESEPATYPVPDVTECAGGWSTIETLAVGKFGSVLAHIGNLERVSGAPRPALADEDQHPDAVARYKKTDSNRRPRIPRARRKLASIAAAGSDWASELLAPHARAEYTDTAGAVWEFLHDDSGADRIQDILLMWRLIDCAQWLSRWTTVDNSDLTKFLHRSPLLMTIGAARDIFQWLFGPWSWQKNKNNDLLLQREIWIRREAAKIVWSEATKEPIKGRISRALDRWYERPRERGIQLEDIWYQPILLAAKRGKTDAEKEQSFRLAFRKWCHLTLRDRGHNDISLASCHELEGFSWPPLRLDLLKYFEFIASDIELEPTPEADGRTVVPRVIPSHPTQKNASPS